MKTAKLFCFVALWGCVVAPAMARELAPLITTDALAQKLPNLPNLPNLDDAQFTIIDIRTAARYAKGHIPGALNIPVSLWAPSTGWLSLELPEPETLRRLLGEAGITATRNVVIVNHTENDFARADPFRVAWTCAIAGAPNVSVLDGGIDKWIREKKPLTTVVPQVRPVTFDGKYDASSRVDKDYVRDRSAGALLIDTRLPGDYFGVTAPEGHIKGAKSLPLPWQFTQTGALGEMTLLRDMAAGVMGGDKEREIILYCGVGGFAAAEWFILTELLGYRQVKVYDGSMEEWIKDPTAPVVSYQWE